MCSLYNKVNGAFVRGDIYINWWAYSPSTVWNQVFFFDVEFVGVWIRLESHLDAEVLTNRSIIKTPYSDFAFSVETGMSIVYINVFWTDNNVVTRNVFQSMIEVEIHFRPALICKKMAKRKNLMKMLKISAWFTYGLVSAPSTGKYKSFIFSLIINI